MKILFLVCVSLLLLEATPTSKLTTKSLKAPDISIPVE